MITEVQPIRIFIAYSHKDRAYLDELRVHAAPLTRNQRLRIWFDGEIHPGEVWDNSIKENLHAAHIILLLLSANSLYSEYFYEKEVREALERHADGRARVVPVLLAPCLWYETPLAHLQGLPDGMKAISAWLNRDSAWENVLHGILRIIGEIERNESPAVPTIDAPAPPPLAKANPADEMLWKIARKNNSRTAFQGYLEKMPQGLHSAEARDILERLDADDALWDYVNAPGTQNTFESNLEDYLEAFPDGLHAAKARGKLDEFAQQREEIERQKQQEVAEKADWQTAEKTDTEAAYRKYLTNHPYSPNATQARKKITAYKKARTEVARKKQQNALDLAEWEVANKADTELAYKKYLQQHPEGLYAVQAYHRQQALLLEAEAAAQKQLEEEKAARLAVEAKRAKEADPFADLMIHINGGTFVMGDTFGDGAGSEQPTHRVTIKGFSLCKHPVTQAQWKSFMGKNPSFFKGDDLPVESVNWEDVQIFIQKLNEKTSKKYRLPTEAEWEYAAREGGKKVRFGNGRDIADPDEINFDALKKYQEGYSKAGEYREETTPVAAFSPNALGLYDMSGNVWELCQDIWHDNYYGAPDDGSAWEKGGDGSNRVVRGGSWYFPSYYCRATCRPLYGAVFRPDNIGFRLAL